MYINLMQHEGEHKDVVLTANLHFGYGDNIIDSIKDLATEIVQADMVKEFVVHDTLPGQRNQRDTLSYDDRRNPRRWNGYYTRELARALNEFNERVSAPNHAPDYDTDPEGPLRFSG